MKFILNRPNARIILKFNLIKIKRTGIFAWLILNEEYTILDLSSVIVSFVGCILILKPQFYSGNHENFKDFEGKLIAILSSIFFALVIIVLRKIGDQSSVFENNYVFSFVSAYICGVLMPFNGVKEIHFRDIFFCILNGVISFLG